LKHGFSALVALAVLAAVAKRQKKKDVADFSHF
jgi:hypothetical protein